MQKSSLEMKHHILCFCFTILFGFVVLPAFIIPTTAWAQAQQPKLKDLMGKPTAEETEPEEQTEPASKKTDVPLDELDRGVPQSSLTGFFNATKERDYEKAARYLDLRRLPKRINKKQGPILARRLKIILSRATWIDLDTLSIDPEGHHNDGLPSYRDLVCKLTLPQKDVDILMQRVPRSDGTHIWKFSSTTVTAIPELYDHFGYGQLDAFLPEVFFDIDWLGVELWMWISLIVLLATGYLIAFFITILLTFLLSCTKIKLSTRLKRFIALPVRFLLTLLLAQAFLSALMNPTPALQAFLKANTLLIIVLTWLAMGILDYIFYRLENHYKQEEQDSSTVMFLPTLKNTIKLMLIICAIIFWLDNLGFQVTTLIAGLGVGSIAIALAAQKSIENFIGAITLYTSKPVKVGDFCRFGDTLGTVEQIGLRATQIRTLDHSIVTVPNAEFVNLHLDNLTERRKILYKPRISLVYGTSPDQIRSILDGIKKMLSDHPRVLPDPARVRFTSFGDYSLDLDIFAYIDETHYGEYLEISEDINLRIMDIIAREGSRLAIPSQTNYLKNETGLRLDTAPARTIDA